MIWDETRGNQRWLYPNVPKGEWVDESMAAPGMKFYFSDEMPGWNELEITASGMRFHAVLNGIEIMKYDGEGVLNDDIHKKYRVGEKGRLALQIHRGDSLKIRYKDISIKVLHP